MNLYFFPGACSLVINIALREAKLPFTMTEVDYTTRRVSDGSDFRTVNPKGYVPALLLEDGRCLTEVIAILDHIDFEAPKAGLIGRRGTRQRQLALEWLGFLSTEIHKSFSPLFRPDTPAAFLKAGQRHLKKRLQILEYQLSSCSYLAGNAPSAADFYLFTLSRWMGDVGLRMDSWPNISKHFVRIKTCSSVQNALISENLCPELPA